MGLVGWFEGMARMSGNGRGEYERGMGLMGMNIDEDENSIMVSR